MKIKDFLFSTTSAGLTVLSLIVGSCQKDNIDPSDSESLKWSEKSAQSLISNTKQEREILFISKRDGTTDEIYAMNADGSNDVR